MHFNCHRSRGCTRLDAHTLVLITGAIKHLSSLTHWWMKLFRCFLLYLRNEWNRESSVLIRSCLQDFGASDHEAPDSTYVWICQWGHPWLDYQGTEICRSRGLVGEDNQHGFPLKGISYPCLCPYMLCLSAASRGTALLCYALPTIVSLVSGSER